MLENWVRDKAVLDGFAADYRDPTRKIPQDLLDRLQEVRLATIATFYRRQLTFGLLDLALHGAPVDGQPVDAVKVTAEVFRDVFFPVPEGTAFVAYFGHLNGYDGGYYGYAWADAIAADLATVFRKAPDRFLDAQAGRRLRDEIYAPGGSREAEVSIRSFLGRERSLEPFLQSIGIVAE
jgi:Zn-dependent oligopeptidase